METSPGSTGSEDPHAVCLAGTEIYVSREEILHENPVNPKIAKGMEVEFLVAKDNDKYQACEVRMSS